jgi:hypothetical protein
MITRQLNMFLWTSTAVLSCGAVAVLTFGLFAPLQPAAPASTSTAGSTIASQRTGTDLPPLDSFNEIFKRPLRVALTDAPAAAPVPTSVSAPATAAPPPLVLVGTIGQSLAMIRTADGNIAVKGVGEHVGEADVLAIRPTQVDIRIGGKTVTLEKPVETNDNP